MINGYCALATFSGGDCGRADIASYPDTYRDERKRLPTGSIRSMTPLATFYHGTKFNPVRSDNGRQTTDYGQQTTDNGQCRIYNRQFTNCLPAARMPIHDSRLTIHDFINQKKNIMTKTIFGVSVVLLCCFTACNTDMKETSASESGTVADNSVAEKNLEASRTVSKAFETGDLSKIDSVVASDFVDHTDRGDMGRDSLKAMITSMRAAFPDLKTEIIRELADNDYVFTLMRITGTSSGAMGMPKGPYDMHAIQVAKMRNGKIVEHWEYMQPVEMMKMMGQMPPDNKSKADTAKKKSK
jgi:predicted SnoaL-like aldol condensation-catalyzing enzyme